MFEAYFQALLARNRLITDTMIRNQKLVADMFSRHLDFGAEFLQHQMRVISIVTQWRDTGTQGAAPGAEPPSTAVEDPAEKTAGKDKSETPPALKVVGSR